MEKDKLKACIELCYECAGACDECVTEGLREKSRIDFARGIELNIYCSEVCRLAASLIARGSEFAPDICAFCAKVCNSCANESAKHQNTLYLQSAFLCRRCAEECMLLAPHAAA